MLLDFDQLLIHNYSETTLATRRLTAYPFQDFNNKSINEVAPKYLFELMSISSSS